MPTLQRAPAEREPPAESADFDDTDPTAPFPYGDTVRGESIAFETANGVLVGVDGTTASADPTVCPSCDGETVNGAGLFACVDCEWTGRLR